MFRGCVRCLDEANPGKEGSSSSMVSVCWSLVILIADGGVVDTMLVVKVGLKLDKSCIKDGQRERLRGSATRYL